MYRKYCPKCGKEQVYKNEVTFKKAVKTNCLCKSCARGCHATSNIKRLLSEELESYYWIGFLLADGHISNNRVTVGLSAKDKEHLQKFSQYVDIKHIAEKKAKNGNYSVYVSAQDTKNIPILIKKFDIKNNKTYNPPSIDIFKNLPEDKLLSLIIGFIDGDGSIHYVFNRRDWCITIKNYITWKDILVFFKEKICNKTSYVVSYEKYAQINITDVPSTIKLKKFAIGHKLPIMKRKWDVIDINYITFYQIANERLNIIKKLALEGKTIKEMQKHIDMSYESIYAALKRHNIKYNKYERKLHSKKSDSKS